MRYFIEKYDLDSIKKINKFKEIIDYIKLKEKLNINNNQDIYNIYFTTLNLELRKYFYSFLSVINNIEKENLFKIYENVIINLDKDI